MKCFCADGMSTSMGLGLSDAQPKSRRTRPKDAYRRAAMCSSCPASECAEEYERHRVLSSASSRTERRAERRAGFQGCGTGSGKNDGAGVPRRQAVCVRAKRVLVAAVAGALDLVEPIGELLVVEVELLIVAIRLPVLERNLRGRILGLRRHALALDARRLSGNLRAGLCP